MVIRIQKGFDIPIAGVAAKRVREGIRPPRVAIKPPDFPGLRPKVLVKPGDPVSIGTPLVEDKFNPAIRLVSPGGGKVAAVVRGERRRLEIISVELDAQEKYETYPSHSLNELNSLDRETIIRRLLAAGLWPLLKQRPYGKIADPAARPRSIYINGMDTEPLAADPEFLLRGKEEFFRAGLKLIAKLTEGKTYLCISGGCQAPALLNAEGVEVRKFSGPHPAGLVSTHIQLTEPYRKGDILWYLRTTDVVHMGELFLSGKLNMERLIAVAGPGALDPCYVRTRAGVPVLALAEDMCGTTPHRYISGTILTGQEEAPDDFLGFPATTMTILPLDQRKKFLGWLAPQFETHSWFRLYGGHFQKKLFRMGAMLHAGHRAILPIGCHEEMTPLDIHPLFLIKAILAGDLEEAEDLGLLECVEEDMALMTYVDPSKLNYGEILRQGLERHEKEG